jgi:hypothetical protein
MKYDKTTETAVGSIKETDNINQTVAAAALTEGND